MKTGFVVLLCFLCSISHLFAQQPVASFPPTDSLPSVTLPPEIDRVLRDYERAWQANNTEALVALFTPDGFVMQPRPTRRNRTGKSEDCVSNWGWTTAVSEGRCRSPRMVLWAILSGRIALNRRAQILESLFLPYAEELVGAGS